MMLAKRIAYTLLCPAIVCLMAWLAGYNFDERGYTAFLVFYVSLGAALFVWWSPSWKPLDRDA